MQGQNRTRSAHLAAIAIFAIAAISRPAVADVPASQQDEVAHLLQYIRTSSCRFVRNGKDYDGERAYRHVLRKYDYFRNRITSTEDFIELSASVSTFSGEPYEFACGAEPRRSSQGVLLGELRRFRAGRATSSNVLATD